MERDGFTVRWREMCRGRTTERDRLEGERWFYGKFERYVSREDEGWVANRNIKK